MPRQLGSDTNGRPTGSDPAKQDSPGPQQPALPMNMETAAYYHRTQLDKHTLVTDPSDPQTASTGATTCTGTSCPGCTADGSTEPGEQQPPPPSANSNFGTVSVKRERQKVEKGSGTTGNPVHLCVMRLSSRHRAVSVNTRVTTAAIRENFQFSRTVDARRVATVDRARISGWYPPPSLGKTRVGIPLIGEALMGKTLIGKTLIGKTLMGGKTYISDPPAGERNAHILWTPKVSALNYAEGFTCPHGDACLSKLVPDQSTPPPSITNG